MLQHPAELYCQAGLPLKYFAANYLRTIGLQYLPLLFPLCRGASTQKTAEAEEVKDGEEEGA